MIHPPCKLFDGGFQAKSMAEQTALTMAVDRGHTAIVQTLLAAGADANSKFKRGYNKSLTVLMSAAKEGNVDMVNALLEAGADINAIDRDGQTALSLAASSDHANVVQILKKAGAKK